MDLKDLLCTHCGKTLMGVHPEKPWELEKCPLCGFTRKLKRKKGYEPKAPPEPIVIDRAAQETLDTQARFSSYADILTDD